MAKEYDPFKNRHKFQDDVWGQIRLNDLERDVIDTPEFQRLFRTSQMGFVELVYHTANHTRGAHSIGACRITNRLINRLVENTDELYEKYNEKCSGLYADFDISLAERILIRLGALLHDISHVPLSHDLERKTHKIFYPGGEELKLKSWYGHYDKHDDYDKNPLLFMLVCDRESSVLARVLRYYSRRFWKQLQDDAKKEEHGHIKEFVEIVSRTNDGDWKPTEDLLPELLFHLLFYEKPGEAKEAARKIVTRFGNDVKPEKWHLGPKSLTFEQVKEWHNSWYQPYRHDIIGNTLSADLIDYLTRDPQRLGTQRRIDLHLLSYYALVNAAPNESPKRYRCALDLHDHKRSTTRIFLLNDLFRLLDLRQDIHEKAVTHRVVQSAIAMLARGLLLLGRDDLPRDEDKRPPMRQIVGLENNQCHALQGEDLFFNRLLQICEENKSAPQHLRRRLGEAHRIFQKLIERRVCRPLVIIPGDWIEEKLALPMAKPSASPDFFQRTLAAIVDSAYYSPFILFACATVEKYLEGVFDTDSDVCSYAEMIAAGDASTALVEQARNLVPSRVITSTTPYKQLYKDPAAVVALEGCVGQIDELSNTGVVKDKSTRERIENAICDADNKYATLWQLYVFISDGLFYSGVLNKLLNQLASASPQTKERDGHADRLSHSQEFLSLAFKTICNHWPGPHAMATHVKDKQKILGTRMDVKAFKDVIRSWVDLYKGKSAWTGPWSTVDVKQYYHECSIDERVDEKLKRPCRDSRYKFDRDAQQVWENAEKTTGSDEYQLVSFLKECHLDNPKLLSESEFRHLVQLYADKDTREKCKSLLEAGSVSLALKTLWLRDFPWPKHEAKPVVEAKPIQKTELPVGRAQIRDWVFEESRILNLNVRRRLITEEIEPILDVLELAASRHGRAAVGDDFRLRVQNESALMWNDVRDGRMVNTLRRMWNLPVPTATANASGEDKGA